MPAPEPVRPEPEAPYYGPVLAALIKRAQEVKRGRVPERHDEAYAAIQPYFDHAFYLATNRDLIALENFDLVAHYLRAGAAEKRDPAPWFSTSDYLARFPEVETSGVNPFYHWLTTGRAEGVRPFPMRHFDTVAQTAGLDPATARDLWQARYEDLRARLSGGPLGAQVQKATALEPLVAQTWPDALAVKIPPFHTALVNERTSGIFRLAQAADMAHGPLCDLRQSPALRDCPAP